MERAEPHPLSDAALHPRSTVEQQDNSGAYVQALREEYRALGKIQAVLGWYTSTQGEPSLGQITYLGHDRLFQQAALQAIGAAQGKATGNEAQALKFLKRTLTGEIVALSIAKFDDEYSDTEAAATVTVPGREKPVAYRDMQGLIAQEPDAAKRTQAYAAMNAVRVSKLNPILERKEKAAQAAAREAGFADYVALSEDLREVQLQPLLASGVTYVQKTDALFKKTLDRVAHEELGLGREQMRLSDFSRLWKSPRLSKFFDNALELKTLLSFLGGIGLDLRSAVGTEVQIDDSVRPKKRPRAFVQPVDPPGDVRLSVKPVGGLDDYWTLFHEAGHAVHFASTTIEPKELVQLGYGAPTEAFGEFFRHAFSDPHFLVRYQGFLKAEGKPAPTNAELSAILRRTALIEMMYIRRYAFAKTAYELRLHGRPATEIAAASAVLPDAARASNDLRELYRQCMSVAYSIELNEAESQAYRTDVDDTFYSADYARAFALAGMMHEGMRRRFGDDWYGNHDAGKFLRERLFTQGTALSSEDVAERMGFSRKVDFEAAAARAERLIAEADKLER